MSRTLRGWVLFVIALAPSAYLAWSWRDMPQLGLHHDDGLYLVGAKSLAAGNGYRIESLPGQPFETKYPPMLPLLLAPLWKFGPGFPAILKPAMLLVWLMLPLYLYCMRAVFRQFGFGSREAWLLTFAAGMHPLICLLSTAIMSDLLFLSLYLGCLLWAEKALECRQGARLALAAGLLGGLAYLTRTAALPLVLTAPLCFFLRRRFRSGLLFLAGMLPAIAGWIIWVQLHLIHTHDPAIVYYTNYLGMQMAAVRADNFLRVLWINSDALLRSMGKLIMFDAALVENVHCERIVGAAALLGAIRLWRRCGRIQLPAAAAAAALLLLGYHYTSDERLSLPAYPMVLMGFWTEAKHFYGVWRVAWQQPGRASRLVALGTGAIAAAAGLFIVATYFLGNVFFLPKLYAQCRADMYTHRPAYTWLAAHTAASAAIYGYDDPVLYLYAGRRAMGFTMPSARIYGPDPDREANRFVRSVPQLACAHGLDYLLLTSKDFYREARPRNLVLTAAADTGLRHEYTSGGLMVYRCPTLTTPARP